MQIVNNFVIVETYIRIEYFFFLRKHAGKLYIKFLRVRVFAFSLTK
jgi:hypothetical protein